MSEMSQAEMQINFSALNKLDPSINRIIDTASSVAHYKFKASSAVWDKTEVEGSLFLYSRTEPPYTVIFIMNRLNTKNTKLYLTADMDFKVQKPFLLCKAANSEIIGIWFFADTECERFGALLSKYALLAKDEKLLKATLDEEKRKIDLPAVPKKNDLLQMFSTAHVEYRKNRAPKQIAQVEKGKSPSHKDSGKQKQKKAPIILKRHSETNLKNLSENALTPPNQHNKTNRKLPNEQKPEQLKTLSQHEENIIMQILQGGDKKHRVRTQSTSVIGMNSAPRVQIVPSRAGDLAEPTPKIIDCAALESELLSKQKKPAVTTVQQLESTRPSAAAVAATGDLTNENAAVMDTASLKFKEEDVIKSFVKGEGNVKLLSPSVLAAKTTKGRGMNLLMNGQPKNSALAANFSLQTSKKKLFADETANEPGRSAPPASSLMSPAAFQVDNKVTLTKEEFQQALLHCIQNDESFVTTLHDAYLNVRRNGR